MLFRSALVTHTPNGINKFEESRDGLHHCKLSKGHEEEVKEQDSKAKKRVSFVKTLEESKRRCTSQEVNRAKEARKFCHDIGTPTLESVKHSM